MTCSLLQNLHGFYEEIFLYVWLDAVNGGAMAPTVKPEGLLVLLVMTQTDP